MNRYVRWILAFFAGDVLTGMVLGAFALEGAFLLHVYLGWAASPGPIQTPWLVETLFVVFVIIPATIYLTVRKLPRTYRRILRFARVG